MAEGTTMSDTSYRVLGGGPAKPRHTSIHGDVMGADFSR